MLAQEIAEDLQAALEQFSQIMNGLEGVTPSAGPAVSCRWQIGRGQPHV